MKYNVTCKMFCNVLNGIVKKEIRSVDKKEVLKNIMVGYKKIVERAKDIGSDNMLLSSYLLAAYFISMNRITKYTAEENFEILNKGLKNSKLLKVFLGNEKEYFSEKKMNIRKEWSKKTYKRKYENDWIVDVIEKKENDDFVFGLDYKECGVCKLCHDENCFELAKYLCKLDFMLVEIIGVGLNRTKTLADGNDKCDFRFKKLKKSKI